MGIGFCQMLYCQLTGSYGFFFKLFIWFIPLFDFRILDQFSMFGINLTWSLYMLLDLVCQSFVDDFYSCIQKRYCSPAFFSCDAFVWLQYLIPYNELLRIFFFHTGKFCVIFANSFTCIWNNFPVKLSRPIDLFFGVFKLRIQFIKKRIQFIFHSNRC